MNRRSAILLAALGAVTLALALALWLGIRQRNLSARVAVAPAAGAPARAIAFYQHPDGAADYSPVPKNDEKGRPYVPVYEDAPAGHSAADHPPAAAGASPATAPPATAPPATAPPAKAAPAAAKRGRILYYRNPMGLADVSPVPKKDGMGMDYVPVYEGEDGGGGSFTLSVEKVQRLGVGTAPAERRVLARAVRAVGSIQFDERSRAVVTTRFDGWVERLEANITGQRVRKGEALLYLYSPEAVQAEQDYLAALAAREEMAAGEAAKAADSLVDGALQRLGNLGIPAPEVERLRRERKAGRLVPVPAPLSGVVLEKDVVQGQRVMAGEALYRLAATDPVWLIAEVFEQDLRLVVPGQAARVTVLAWPGRVFTGRVAYVYPMLSPETRTGRVRIEIPNPKEELKADMYGDVELAAQPGAPVLAVPDSAVLDTGTRRVLFVERAGGRYEPREVKLGGAGGGFVEVLAGIAEGERVVVRANFLIDAESNMRAALQSLTPPEVKP